MIILNSPTPSTSDVFNGIVVSSCFFFVTAILGILRYRKQELNWMQQPKQTVTIEESKNFNI